MIFTAFHGVPMKKLHSSFSTFSFFLIISFSFSLYSSCSASSEEVQTEDDDRRVDPNSDDRRPTDTGVNTTGRDTGSTTTDSGSTTTDSGSTTTDSGSTTITDSGSTNTDTGPTGASLGASCMCDSDCAGTTYNQGFCFNGICMQYASGTCSSGGSSTECNSGSYCWESVNNGSICWPDASEVACAGVADDDDSCVAAPTSRCDDTCSELCRAPYNGQPLECPENAHPNEDRCLCNDGFVLNSADDCVAVKTPGSACNCDSECEGTTANAGVCIYGICMQRASIDCPADGSNIGTTTGCSAGSRCWGIGEGPNAYLCWPNCDTYSCAGECDDDGSCTPNNATSCDNTCGLLCRD